MFVYIDTVSQVNIFVFLGIRTLLNSFWNSLEPLMKAGSLCLIFWRWKSIHVLIVASSAPHPNDHVQMGKSDKPIFLESFLEANLKLNKWIKSNSTNLNCENIGIELKQNILPNTYKTFLQEECKLNNHQLSYKDSLKLFHPKSISDSTTWR